MIHTHPNISLEGLTLAGLFAKQLSIPDYQRAYSWKSAHVSDLLNDTFGRATPYLMGTIILHGHQQTLDIVDGQQRLVTLTVLLHILTTNFKCQPELELPLLNAKYSDGAAVAIRKTRDIITNFLRQKSEPEITAYYNLLTQRTDAGAKPGGPLIFSVLTLTGDNALDQAYTFFDSVNSKGKPLSDFDLLKAHHLMFIPPRQEALATSHNNRWQEADESHSLLFGSLLRRIRMWARGESRDSKQERPDYNEFCSVVEPDPAFGGEHALNRYMQPAAFRSWRRDGERVVLSMDYPMLEGEQLVPTEVTQTIEGGDAFFLYAKRYHHLYSQLFSHETPESSTAVVFVRKLAEHMTNTYLQNAFRAAMLLAFDKFGEDCLIDMSVYVERIISARRFAGTNLRIEGVFDHIRDSRIIPILLNSISTAHVTAQLHSTAKSLPHVSIDQLSGVRKAYYVSLKQFYQHNAPKIPGARPLALTSLYLKDNSNPT